MKSDKTLNILVLIIVILFIVSKSSSLKYKLAGVVQSARFKIITKNMEMKELNNITVYYSNKRDETYINDLKEYLIEGEDKAVPLLGKTSMYPFNIIIFTTSEEFGEVFKVQSKEIRAVTIFDSLYIPCDNISPYVFVHEYTHYKLNSFCKQNGISIFKLPIWFQEGIAEYAGSSLFSNKFKNLKIRKIQDFRKLNNNNQIWESEDEGEDSYMQSYLAVKKIIELKGKNSIQEILINTKSMTFYNAFKKVIGLSIDDFQKLLN